MFVLHIFISLALALQRLARKFVRLIALARCSRSGSLEPILCIFYTELLSFYGAARNSNPSARLSVIYRSKGL
jgi:hypothetical protein